MQSWIQDNEVQSKVCSIPLTQPWKRHLTSRLKDLISYLLRKKLAVGVLLSLSFCLDWEYFEIALFTVAISFGAASIIKQACKSVSGLALVSES